MISDYMKKVGQCKKCGCEQLMLLSQLKRPPGSQAPAFNHLYISSCVYMWAQAPLACIAI